MEVYKNRKIATCNNNEDIICSIRLDLQAYPEIKNSNGTEWIKFA